jgi:hypothetical protein
MGMDVLLPGISGASLTHWASQFYGAFTRSGRKGGLRKADLPHQTP